MYVRDNLSDDKGNLPDVSKDFGIVFLEGLKTTTYGVFWQRI